MLQFDMSGKFVNDGHSLNKPDISITLIVFHFDKSGKFINEEHL